MLDIALKLKLLDNDLTLQISKIQLSKNSNFTNIVFFCKTKDYSHVFL